MNNKLSTIYRLFILMLISGKVLAGAFFGPEPTPSPVVSIDTSSTSIISPSIEKTAESDLVGYSPTVSLNGRYVYFLVFPGDLPFNDLTAIDGAYLYDRQTGESTPVELPAEVVDGSISMTVIGVSDDGTVLYARTGAAGSPSNTSRTEAYTIATKTRKVLTTLASGEGVSPHDSIQIRANAASQRFNPTQSVLAYVSIYDGLDVNGEPVDNDGNLNLYVKDLAQDQVTLQREIPFSSAEIQSFGAVRFSSDLSYVAVQSQNLESVLTMNVTTGAVSIVNVAGLYPSDRSTRVMQISNDGLLLGMNVYYSEADNAQLLSEYSITVNTANSTVINTVRGVDLDVPNHAVTLVPGGGDFPSLVRYWTVDFERIFSVIQNENPLTAQWPSSTMVVEKNGLKETQQLLYDVFESGFMDLQNQLSADGSVYVFPSASNQLVESDTNIIFAKIGIDPILTLAEELEVVNDTTVKVIGSNVFFNNTQLVVGTEIAINDVQSGQYTIRLNGKDVFIRQMGGAVNAGTTLIVTPELAVINTANITSANIDLELNANELFAIEVECTPSNDNITLNSRAAGSVFPSAPQSLLVDTTSLNENTFAQATSLSAFINSEGAFVAAPEPITASGIYASLVYNVQPVSGTTDVNCTARGSDANGLPQTISVTNATITLDNGINPVDGNGQLVSGTVIVPEGVDPSSIVVTLTINDVSVTTTVDANGVFTFENIRSDDVVVSVDAPNAVAECTAAAVGSEAVSTGDIAVYRGDINNDGTVDIADFTFLSSRFGLSEGDNRFRARADLNKDGVINVQDLAILGSALGIAACDPLN